MIDEKLMEVLTTPPDAALAIVTQGPAEPHAVNSWNSYVHVNAGGKLLIPAGRMVETEKNIERSNRVILTITNREVQGKAYKGTGFLVKGTAYFAKDGADFDTIKAKFPWARAALSITIESMEQTL
jgi:predicted pyridoxine 5'-phosphate oxidase superfamily flavin-nucleotide-binding protein